MLPPVKVVVQVAEEAVLAVSVQFGLVGDTPAPLAVKLTLPVGVVGVPEDVSVTVAVQTLEAPIAIELGTQLTVVVVVRALTTCDTVLDVLPAKFVSAPYTAVIECVATVKADVLKVATPAASVP